MHSFLFGKLCFQHSVKSWCLFFVVVCFVFFLLRKVLKYEISVIFHSGVPLQAICRKQNSRRFTFTEQIVYNFIIVSETLLVQN